MSFDPDRIYHQLTEAGEEWADKEAAAELLEENKKTVLAEVMAGFQGTAAERERNALADSTFKLHLKNMVAARREANRARVRYDSMKVLAEMRRTESANRRAEMNLR